MDLTITIVNWILVVIMCAIFGTWLYLFIYTIKSFKQSPILESFDRSTVNEFQKVSVILPARNEEKYIGKCLDSLLKQDYSNFEIIFSVANKNDPAVKVVKNLMKKFPKVDAKLIIGW